jgi:putative two-component system response regulator
MSIANAIEAKDIVTNGHINRVAYWANKIGENMGFSTDELEFLRKGAMLHDIGKMGIPDNILNKPGPLTKEEFDIMKTHTVIGEKIISSLKSFENIKTIIRHHHEKLDGSGYPDNLTASQIDIYTRIIAIVDIYDALTDDRPYRRAMSKTQAFSILQSDVEKGLLDASIVEMLRNEVSKKDDLVRAVM